MANSLGYDLSEAYSLMYGKILTPSYRRTFLDWIRTNHPESLARIIHDHKVKIEDYGFVD